MRGTVLIDIVTSCSGNCFVELSGVPIENTDFISILRIPFLSIERKTQMRLQRTSRGHQPIETFEAGQYPVASHIG